MEPLLSTNFNFPIWGRLITTLFVLLSQTIVVDAHAQNSDSKACPALLNHSVMRLQDEKSVSLCQYSGQVLLVVNTASYCGYTEQYAELEKLHSRLNSQGFQVLGFPSNDFGGQEPKTNKDIAAFCTNTYGVKFPMFAKSKVVGTQPNPFYKQLIQLTGVEPTWNFYKYLIGRDGKVIKTYRSQVSPSNNELSQDIQKALAQKG